MSGHEKNCMCLSITEHPHCTCGWEGKYLREKLAAEKDKNKRLRDEIQARRQWQKCPQCNKTFATDS